MSFACCLKACKSQPLNKWSSRVEIKSVIPSSGLQRHKKSFLVSWKRNGEAIFHPECWADVLSVSRRRGGGNRKRKLSTKSHNEENVMIQSEKVMIREANKTVEKFDSADDIEKCAIKVAEMLRQSKHCVFFTGAGISTSAGMGDFRGKSGKWTEQDRETIDIDHLFEASEEIGCAASPEKMSRYAQVLPNKDQDEKAEVAKEEEEVNYEDLRPTFTHEAISKLVELGHIKYVISQNCDGLHLLSGVPPESISELHGNVFVEKCEKCDKRFQRSHYVCDDVADLYLEELADNGKTDIIKPKFMKKCEKCELSHRTGRKCDEKHCKGFLMDTIINFRDHLEDSILDRAFDAADSCDLMLCLGSTLTVTPANELVDYVRNPRRIVICNRQPTEKDESCWEKDDNGEPLGVRVFGDCDVFVKYLMQNILDKKHFDAFENDLQTKARGYDDIREKRS